MKTVATTIVGWTLETLETLWILGWMLGSISDVVVSVSLDRLLR